MKIWNPKAERIKENTYNVRMSHGYKAQRILKNTEFPSSQTCYDGVMRDKDQTH